MKKLQYYLIGAKVENGELIRIVWAMEQRTKLWIKLQNWYLRRKKLPAIWRLPTEIYGEIKPA